MSSVMEIYGSLVTSSESESFFHFSLKWVQNLMESDVAPKRL